MTESGPGPAPLVAILRAPVEATSSFLWGSSDGPDAVADEISSLELHDPEVASSVATLRLEHDALGSRYWTVPDALDALEAKVARWLERGAFPLTLGGEHTVTLGPLRAVTRHLDTPVGVVQLDAHGDLRASFEGRGTSHACVMRRVVDDLGLSLLGLGIRSVCSEEVQVVAGRDDLRHIGPRRLLEDPAALDEAVEALPRQVYLTIDMDVFDPSVAPGVGTPESGGLDWAAVSRIIDVVARRRHVVGADVVELAPSLERWRTVRLASRVAIRVLLRTLEPARRRRGFDET